MKPTDFSIRFVEPQDAGAIAEIYAPSIENSAISFEEVAPSTDEMRVRIEKVSQKFPWLVAVTESGQIVGYAYASPHRDRAAYRWSVEVSAYVRTGFQGQGIGRKLYEKLLENLRQRNFYRAFAGVTLPNPGSIALHEGFGFEHLGTYAKVGFKNGQWHDVGWWQLSLREGDPGVL